MMFIPSPFFNLSNRISRGVRKLATMSLTSHSSTFLLPNLPADDGPALTYALVILNQSLPKFTPLLWKHGNGLAALRFFSTFFAVFCVVIV